MKKVLGIVLGFTLVLAVAGQAAASFEGGNLLVSIYKPGQELGLETQIDVDTYDFAGALDDVVGSFSLGDFNPGTNWADLYVGIYGAEGKVNSTMEFMATKLDYAPAINAAAFGTAESGMGSVNGYYDAKDTNNDGKALGLPGDADSYYQKMDLGTTPGKYANLNNGYVGLGLQGEANLGALSTTDGYVDMYLYKIVKSGRSAVLAPGNHGEAYQAVIRLTPDGDVIVNPSAVPVPGAVLLFGTGLLGFFGIRRKKA